MIDLKKNKSTKRKVLEEIRNKSNKVLIEQNLNYEINKMHKINEDNTNDMDNNKINELTLSKNVSEIEIPNNKSKRNITIRIIILFLICIYIPIDIFFAWKFNKIEKKFIFDKIIHNSQLETILSNAYIKFISNSMIYLLGNKDAYMLYSLILYICYHPFLSVKIISVVHFTEFFISIIRCLYQSKRPLWIISEKLHYLCPRSYASPSLHFFFICFYFLYAYINISKLNKYKKFCQKIIFTIILFIFMIILGILLILYKINFVYQLNFGITISILFLCLSIDFESYIHNFILDSLKNVYKARRNKMKIFILTIILNISSLLLLNNDNEISYNYLQKVVSRMYLCQNLKDKIGLKATFLETTYSFGIIGAFWGASLTLENPCGNWWNSSTKNKFIKLSISLLLGFGYIIMFNYFESTSFEFNYFTCVIKYLSFYYIFMGYMPILFNRVGLNKENVSKNKSQLFRKSCMTTFLNDTIQEDIFLKSSLVVDIDNQNLKFKDKVINNIN